MSSAPAKNGISEKLTASDGSNGELEGTARYVLSAMQHVDRVHAQFVRCETNAVMSSLDLLDHARLHCARRGTHRGLHFAHHHTYVTKRGHVNIRGGGGGGDEGSWWGAGGVGADK